ncbi:MAG: diadenylate cyclase CdaA [Phycisphaerales bacterium]
MAERLIQLLTRLRGYNPVEVAIEFAVIWIVVYLIFRFLRGTRAARMFKGLGVVLIMTSLLILVLARENAFQRIQFLYKGFLGFAAIALVVIFQPELRRALVRLGEAKLFRSAGAAMEPVIDQIIIAVTYLAKNRIGAIIAIERDVPLGGIIEVGTRLNAEVTAELLQTIFWPGSALHDMGVVIHDSKIAAAGVQFPLAEGEDIAQELGSRHRAALGLSQEADCMVIVVSEETGAISLAERGELIRKLSPDALRSMLKRGLKQAATPITNESTDTDDMTTNKDAA